MTWRHGNRREGRVFTGAVFLIIGTVLLLGNLNVLEIRPLLSQWWPLILVVIGIKQLLVLKGPSAWIGALFWIGTGAVFQASKLGYIHVAIGIGVVWPLMLIWFGILLALGHSGCRNSIHDGSKM